MDLKQLRYFLASADEGNMGRAAKRHFVVQSALSRQIQELEREIGAPLFLRTARGVQLTNVGEVFITYARRTVAAADEAMQVARAAVRGEAGRLRVAPPDYGARARQVATGLQGFRTLWPGVEVELVPLPWVEHLEALRDGTIDVGFGFAAGVHDYPEEIVAEAAGREPLRSVLLPADHPLAGKRGLSLADLAPLPMVLSRRSAIPSLYDAVVGALRSRGYEPKVVSAPGAFAGVVQLVAGGAGWVAILDSARRSPPPGTVVRRVRGLAASLEFHVLRRRGPGESLATAFAEWLRRVEPPAAASSRA